jgi:formate dehydrogenase gamma subunit
MHSYRYRGLISILIATVLMLIAAASVDARHPAVFLYDKWGDEINPILDDSVTQPFSTEMSCGMCHDYATITEGYHFQMGWDVISDDYAENQETGEDIHPWSLSNGFMGRWYPFAYRQLAKKENDSPDEIDMTTYEFVGFSDSRFGPLPCGACHPGGGGLQYDRDGDRYDDVLTDYPELKDSLDGDYYQSQWDKSGVVEADCMLCHLPDYNYDARVEQLTNGNYQWAVVAGSRIGIVEGDVSRGQEPIVRYNKRLFNADGSINLPLSTPPPDENCLFCHGPTDLRKRGFSWNDLENSDIHNQQGIRCVSCHPSDLSHQIAMGDDPVNTVAPEHTGSIKDCKECHEAGYLGAPVPDHHSVRPSHLRTITCEACHIPQLGRSAAHGVVMSTGERTILVRPDSADYVNEPIPWYPDYQRLEDGNIYPLNATLQVWWGNRDADGIIYPLFLRETEEAWDLYSENVGDDNEDGEYDVNTDEEIIAGLKAVASSLEGNERFDQIEPVFMKGETAYELDESGALVSSTLEGTPYEGTTTVPFSISHNVAAPGLALGTGGCGDCHAAEAHFFKGQQAVDLYGSDGQMVTQSNGRWYGCDPIAFAINSFHQEIISPFIGIAIMIVIFLIVVHYHSYGPKRITFDPYSQEVERFSWRERAVHLFRLISFVLLAVTGLILAFNLHLWQQLLFASAQQMLDVHIVAGIVFIVTTFGGILLWFRDALFASYDKDWVRRIGGYLGYKGKVPAGRFNAGQKMFYWYTTIFGLIISVTGVILVFRDSFALSTICITSTIHNLMAFILIAGVVAHAYLGTVANPGTWRVLVDGSVTREWAQHHHPQWYYNLLRKGKVEQPTDEASVSTEDDHPPEETDEGKGDSSKEHGDSDDKETK